MNTLHVDVVSAEESIFSGQARFVALPGEAGELGILPKHTPLITRIKPGSVRIERPMAAKSLSSLRAVFLKYNLIASRCCLTPRFVVMIWMTKKPKRPRLLPKSTEKCQERDRFGTCPVGVGHHGCANRCLAQIPR